jgi:hypothetical protein
LLATLGPAPLPADAAGRLGILRACLRADRENMVARFPPFAQLVELAVAVNTPELVHYVSDQMLYDLSVWYHIAWLGESVRREDARVAALVAKASGFDTQDRRDLLTDRRAAGRRSAALPPTMEAGAVNPRRTSPDPAALLDFPRAGRRVGCGPRHARYPGGAERGRVAPAAGGRSPARVRRARALPAARKAISDGDPRHRCGGL